MTLPAGIPPRLLTEAQAADYLGEISVGEVKRQGIGRVPIGRHVRYDRRAIDAWLDSLSDLIPRSAPTTPAPEDPDTPEAALARFEARS